MSLTPRLDLRQTQSLVMTPQLQQAIKLLQFSSVELCEYVEGLLEQNPLLERDDRPEAAAPGEDRAETDVAPAVGDGEPLSVDSAVDGESAYTDDYLDIDSHDNIFDSDAVDAGMWSSDGAPAGGAARGGTFESSDSTPEDLLCSTQTLQEHLASQLAMEIHDPVDRFIGVHLIDMLDEAGYLVGDLGQVAETLGCPLERVLATVERVQAFDPPGIFARSLAECLALQLRDRGWLDEPMEMLLTHLEAVARRDWSTLMRVCGVGAERIQKMVAQLRSLDPKPALVFDHGFTQAIVPDVIMRQQGGGWVVELNSETLPRVLVNNQYYTHVSRSVRKREDKQYVNECFQSANWLIKSLHQRATTILKVASEIIRQQQDFFVSGVQSLKPLVLRDIADAISMHESTVSRVTSNKFVSTPRGIFELKYFFTHAVGNSGGGDSHSAESVRYRIRKMIEGEPIHAVLSDDAVADALQRDGIDIARRTVAKYREAMRIPSSVQRRREKSEVT